MPVVTVYQHGIKAGVSPALSDHQRAKRKTVSGWTAKSARSNLAFLQSVQIDELDGLGHCVTLTVRTCPESAAVWESMRDAYIKRLRRAGLIRFHWVTEWQKRGVPHLHGVAYFPEPKTDSDYADQSRVLRQGWLDVVREYRASELSQHINDIEDKLGWLKYLAKHAARGATHYQRSPESIPKGWSGNTGRMWGKSGTWPVRAGMRFELSLRGFHEVRRVIQRWRFADARSESDPEKRKVRSLSARKMLRCNHALTASVRGFSEWLPMEDQLKLLYWVNRMGHAVIQRDDAEEQKP